MPSITERQLLIVVIIGLLALLLCGFICGAQQRSIQPVSNPSVSSEGKPDTKNQVPTKDTRGTASGYKLGPGDQISIHVVNFEEINDKSIPIDLSGAIRVPMVGRIPVSGLTNEQVGSEIAKRLETY